MKIQMPRLGETIVEGTILKWLKAVGETVQSDEPLFEISTDKVDTEVPSPVTGVLTKILVEEGATVPVGTELAEVESADEGAGAGGAADAAAPATDAGTAGAAAPATAADDAVADSADAPGSSGSEGAADVASAAPPAAPPGSVPTPVASAPVPAAPPGSAPSPVAAAPVGAGGSLWIGGGVVRSFRLW